MPKHRIEHPDVYAEYKPPATITQTNNIASVETRSSSRRKKQKLDPDSQPQCPICLEKTYLPLRMSSTYFEYVNKQMEEKEGCKHMLCMHCALKLTDNVLDFKLSGQIGLHKLPGCVICRGQQLSVKGDCFDALDEAEYKKMQPEICDYTCPFCKQTFLPHVLVKHVFTCDDRWFTPECKHKLNWKSADDIYSLQTAYGIHLKQCTAKITCTTCSVPVHASSIAKHRELHDDYETLGVLAHDIVRDVNLWANQTHPMPITPANVENLRTSLLTIREYLDNIMSLYKTND